MYLKLSDEEFNQYMAGQHPDQLKTPTKKPESPNTNPTLAIQSSKDIASNNHTTPVSITIEQAQEAFLTADNFTNYKFLESEVEELTIGDISKLLSDYKKLVRQNELLKTILLGSEGPIPIPTNGSIASRLDLARSGDEIILKSDELEQPTELEKSPKLSKRNRTNSTST